MNAPNGQPAQVTSPSMAAMIGRAVGRLRPDLNAAQMTKTAVLAEVRRTHGWRAVVELGAEIGDYADHPVVDCLTAQQDIGALVERWQSFEKFGHIRNRTEAIALSRTEVIVRHVSTDGRPIESDNDLFVWGMLGALAQLARFDDVVVETGGVQIYGPGSATGLNGCATDRATIRGVPRVVREASKRSPSRTDAGSTEESLRELIGANLRADWKVADAGRELAMSARSLQRALRCEGTSFSQVLMQTRVDHAMRLFADNGLTLTDIAFCAGFADQPHFTRTFRKFYDVPPSVLREFRPTD